MDTQEMEVNDNNFPTEEELEHEALTRFTDILDIYKIARAEDKKLFCISAMFFLIIYIYFVSKDLKDEFVISRQTPASISILKVFWIPLIATFFLLLFRNYQLK